MKRIIAIIIVFAFITSMTSCIAVGSGGEKIEQKPTLGQEFIDLKRARDEGAISEQEYEEMKNKLKQKREEN